jgi:galactose mutarotase-like enzyme
MEKIDYQGHPLRRWRVGSSTFLAWPERGARLINWNVELGDGSIRDVIHWPEDADFGEIAKVRGGNPILFPFPGRCFDRGDIFFWRTPDGVRRPMPMHGFARQGAFELVHADARGFAARFQPGEEARTAYPFDYEFTVTYRFEPGGLVCEFTLANTGKEPLPWCAGHHFYFRLPWAEGAQRSDYLIRIQSQKRLKQDAQGQMVPGPELHLEENLGNPALIDTHHSQLRSSEAVFGERGKPGDIVVRLGTDSVPAPGAEFVTWTASDDAPFYCVEPWMGPPNAWEQSSSGLEWVKPGAVGRFTVSVALR